MAHLQEAAAAKINAICDRHIGQKTPLIMILSDIQNEYGYIPLEVQELVSARTGISVAEVRHRLLPGYRLLRKGRSAGYRQVLRDP